MTDTIDIGHDELISSASVTTISSRSDGTDSSGILVDHNDDKWEDATDTLLGWLNEADVDFQQCLKSAIDFACDQRDAGASPPSSILATDDGEITFEWRGKRTLFIVTIVDSGIAEYSKLVDCKVVEEGLLRRDPKTRKLQLEG